MPENLMYKHEAEERADQMKQKIESGEVQNYDEAERVLEKEKIVEQLKKSLMIINADNFGHIENNTTDYWLGNNETAIHYLIEARENNLAKELFEAQLKWLILTGIKSAEKCLDSQSDQREMQSAAMQIQHIGCNPVGLRLKYTSDTFKPFRRLVAASFEPWPSCYEELTNIFKDIGDPSERVRMEELIKQRDKDEKNGKKSQKNFNPFINGAKRFLEEIKDDPILQLDEQAVIDHVRQEIEQKLAALSEKSE